MKNILPKTYYKDSTGSDLKLIEHHLDKIPVNFKRDVCLSYSRIYLASPDGRRKANDYLQKTGEGYRQAIYTAKRSK